MYVSNAIDTVEIEVSEVTSQCGKQQRSLKMAVLRQILEHLCGASCVCSEKYCDHVISTNTDDAHAGREETIYSTDTPAHLMLTWDR